MKYMDNEWPNEVAAYDAEKENRRNTLRETINQLSNLSFESAETTLDEVRIKRTARQGGYHVTIKQTSEFFI